MKKIYRILYRIECYFRRQYRWYFDFPNHWEKYGWKKKEMSLPYWYGIKLPRNLK